MSSLSARIFAGYALIIALTLAVAGVVFFSLLGGYRDALDRDSLRQLADQVLFGVTQFSARDASSGEVARYLEAQSEETGALVFILDQEGRVIRDLSPGAEFNDLHLPVTLRDVRRTPNIWLEGEADTGGAPLPYLARFVPVDRLGRGAFVAIALPNAGAGGVVSDLVPRLLISGLVGLAVALVVGYGITRSVYNPLSTLGRAVTAVGLGRYDTRVPETGPTETRDLARAFNRMTEQVQANTQTLQDFMADVSHELRTPLTSIRGFTQAMLDGTVDEPERRERSIQIIDDEARRMLRLVEELLDLSRMQAGETPLRLESVEPVELLTHVAEVFQQRARDAGLDLRVSQEPALPFIRCDFDRMVQVLTNLVDNAFQHTTTGGITLSARRLGAQVELSVADTGTGIPPTDLPNLFRRFFQGRRTPQRRGTGLGLAISREIVLAHDGAITADSTPGEGTIFRITLGAAPTAPNAPTNA